MKTVDELISEWTEDEREKLKDLIEECLERERQLIENSASCRETLSKLAESLSFLFSNLYSIKKKTEECGDELLGIYLNWNDNKLPPS